MNDQETETSALDPAQVEDEHEAELTQQEVLQGMPPLLPACKMRQRQRNVLIRLSKRVKDALDNRSNPLRGDGDEMLELLEALEELDEYFESIAVDAEAYAEWVVGSESETKLLALATRYWRELGE